MEENGKTVLTWTQGVIQLVRKGGLENVTWEDRDG